VSGAGYLRGLVGEASSGWYDEGGVGSALGPIEDESTIVNRWFIEKSGAERALL
jgi:hypothetical protein